MKAALCFNVWVKKQLRANLLSNCHIWLIGSGAGGSLAVAIPAMMPRLGSRLVYCRKKNCILQILLIEGHRCVLTLTFIAMVSTLKAF